MSAEIVRDPGIRAAYETDASGVHLVPEGVARPESVDEVVEIMREAAAGKTSVTCAGAQTSTTAASITDRGIVLSLRSFDGIGEVDREARMMRVRPGALLGAIKRAAAAEGLLFAPDPTSEEESTIGGAIACNASGARTFRYGATRSHIRALKVVLASGDVVQLRRSELEKNTVGYALAHDPIDWFIGSEGTLGVVVEAELSLLPLPARVLGLGIPFGGEDMALEFVVRAREATTVVPRCIEYFDDKAFEMARKADTSVPWPGDANALVYVEQEIGENFDAVLDAWLALLDNSGSDMDPQIFDGESRLRDARRFRHSVPSVMNERGARFREAGGRKVSTDWAVPYRNLAEAIRFSRGLAADRKIEQAVTYGHAGNGHPHQNYIARDAGELATIEEVVGLTLESVLGMGGTVAAEHGIGKIKKKWLPLQMTALQMGMMAAVKHELDPLGILAPGNIL
ncbi:MAG TPA: FAD-binding oxidoreductase [Gemmatimonadaceae bacterium]|nr:FAD-binding oxidoreductase [Gemmatimonadaceae bacterium]